MNPGSSSDDTPKISVGQNAIGKQGGKTAHSTAIIALQFLNGALVTGGGIAFAKFAVTELGTVLGLIHLSIGIIGFLAAFIALRGVSRSKSLLLNVNAVTIAYSSASEIAIYFGSLLPTDAATDSLIGTVIAIIFSCSIIYLLWKSPGRSSRDSLTRS